MGVISLQFFDGVGGQSKPSPILVPIAHPALTWALVTRQARGATARSQLQLADRPI